jgi:hypothetical protein
VRAHLPAIFLRKMRSCGNSLPGLIFDPFLQPGRARNRGPRVRPVRRVTGTRKFGFPLFPGGWSRCAPAATERGNDGATEIGQAGIGKRGSIRTRI